jgi:hypothetical protein
MLQSYLFFLVYDRLCCNLMAYVLRQAAVFVPKGHGRHTAMHIFSFSRRNKVHSERADGPMTIRRRRICFSASGNAEEHQQPAELLHCKEKTMTDCRFPGLQY